MIMMVHTGDLVPAGTIFLGDPWFRPMYVRLLASVVQPGALLSCVSQCHVTGIGQISFQN